MKWLVRLMLPVLPSLLIGTQPDSLARQTQLEIERRNLEVEEKAVEILDLRSAISIQNSELQDLRQQIDSLRFYHVSMNQLLETKDTEINNLKMALSAIREDKQLSQELLQQIQDKKSVPPSPEPPAEPDQKPVVLISDEQFRMEYNTALNLYFDRKYTASIKIFERIRDLHPEHPLADNCQYWLAECYYTLENYRAAVEAFEQVHRFGDGNKADAAQFKIGMSYLKLGQKQKARDAFHILELTYPRSELIPRTREFLTTQEKF